MILKPNKDIQKVIMAFVITTAISLVLAVGILLLTDLYPSRPYTSDSFVTLWFFGFLAIVFGLIAGTYTYNKIKKESGAQDKKTLSDEEELEIQVENYDNLGITKSNKGQATLFLAVVIVISMALGIFNVIPLSDVLYGVIIYIPLTFFIYKGHRWAMYLGIIFWTVDKGYQLLYSSHGRGSIIVILSFWLWLVTILYSAIQVENERKKREGIKKELANTPPHLSERNISEGKYFCSGCGKEINYKGSFCKFCGNKIE